VRIIHAADLHIDSQLDGVSQAISDQVDTDRIATATREAFARLIAWTIETNPDALVLAGDIFDGHWRSAATRRVFLDGLHQLHDAGVPVVMASGNHDAESVLARSMVLPKSAFQMPADAPASYEVPGTNLVVHGQGYAQRDVTENLSQRYPSPVPGMVNVGVLHANVGSSAGHGNYAPCSEDDLLRLGYEYVALGHIHQRREFARDRTFAAYPGNLQGRSVREVGPKGALLVSMEAAGEPTVEFKALDVLRWHHVPVDATQVMSVDEMLDAIAETIRSSQPDAEGRTQIVRVEVSVPEAVRSQVRHTTELKEDIRDSLRGVIVEKVRVHGVASPDAAIDPELAAAIRRGAGDLDSGEVIQWLADLDGKARRQLKLEGVALDDAGQVEALMERAAEDLVARLGGRQ
jgi:DNA repair exonuclease SbcCD nuclease subunit